MAPEIFGLQQIVITIAFLSILVAMLVFFKRKGGFIRANLHGDKRIQLLEETPVSPTEKLRLLSIDGQKFVMASAKGVQPVLTALGTPVPAQTPNIPSFVQRLDEGLEARLSVQATDEGAGMGERASEGKNKGHRPAISPSVSPQIDEAALQAFQEKFKSWRQR